MRLCYIGPGQSVHMQRWVRWLANREHDVHLITEYPVELENVKIHLVRERKGIINAGRRAWEIRKLVKKIKPEILHAHYITGYGFFGALADFYPFVVSAWGSDVLIDARKSFLKRKLIKYALKKADMVHINAPMMKKEIIKLGCSKEKIVMVPFGVDISQFSPKVSFKEVRENFGLEEGPTVISIRHLKKIYDIKTLIMAVPTVLKNVPNAKFIIGGSGELKKSLKDLTKSHGVVDAVKILGLIPHEKIPNYLAASDIYVSTSLSDAMSVSLLEAMGCGLSPIVSDLEGNKELINDGENGLIFPKKDSKKLAEKIIYLSKNEKIRKEFGRKNVKIIKKKYDWNKCMKKIESAYERVKEWRK